MTSQPEPKTTTMDITNITKEKLSKAIKSVSKIDTKLLIMSYADNEKIESEDVFELIDALQDIKDPENTHIDLVIHSGGGEAYAAFKMANIIRSKCRSLHVIVPFYAKSAATLMALSADGIVMGIESELGPLDMPIEHPITENIRISALDGVKPLNFLADFCKTLAIEDLGVQIRKRVGLGRKESVEASLKFVADYIEPIASKLDPLIINMCFRYLQIAQRLGNELLLRYMFNDDEDGKEKASDIIKQLVWGYPEHGFIIDVEEAKRIGLKIIDANKFKRWDLIWNMYMASRNHDSKFFQLTTYDEMEKALKDHNLEEKIQVERDEIKQE